MARGEAMIAAGIGFNSQATAGEIVDLVQAALSARRLSAEDLSVLATELSKASDGRAQRAAMVLAVPLLGLPREDLEAESARAITSSQRVQAIVGVPSVAECAALAAAGAMPELLGARLANGVATCALAKGGDA
ncbi:MAG: cobalamin biosynthesis protein [Pseudomonadota bacterium]